VSSFLVVLPTYNERLNIERVTTGILQHEAARLLVVDDQSPDGTGEIADRLASERYPGRMDVMHRQGPRGLGLSYIDGLRRALGSGADVICQMDADLSHNPSYLPALVDATARFDLVIGSRYLGDTISVVNWPMHRIMLSAFANRYIRLVTGLRPHDCTSGYRAWRREMLARLPLHEPRTSGYAFLTEMLFEAGRLGARMGEVPIVFVERQEGYSKLSKKVLAESLLTPWRLISHGGRLRQSARS
jgi:dolichol-phosphate mannosyltransferase